MSLTQLVHEKIERDAITEIYYNKQRLQELEDFLIVESGGYLPTYMDKKEMFGMLHFLKIDNLIEAPLELTFLPETDGDSYYKEQGLSNLGVLAYTQINEYRTHREPIKIFVYKYGLNDICLLHEFAHVIQYLKNGYLSHDNKFNKIKRSLFNKYLTKKAKSNINKTVFGALRAYNIGNMLE